MPVCDQLRLLLGPFEDGELEPHEMEDVALHIVSCTGCKAALDDYRSLGVALRDCLPQPALEGFTAGVLERIELTPQPLWTRLRSYFDPWGERLGSTASLVAAGAFAALLTAWLVTPYAHHLLRRSPNPNEMASRTQDDRPPSAEQTASAEHEISPDQPDSSMVALSNDPTTTVIWLPNQP
jgi:anti-sigma factor RsiW